MYGTILMCARNHVKYCNFNFNFLLRLGILNFQFFDIKISGTMLLFKKGSCRFLFCRQAAPSKKRSWVSGTINWNHISEIFPRFQQDLMTTTAVARGTADWCGRTRSW